jgi:hypothetical protein
MGVRGRIKCENCIHFHKSGNIIIKRGYCDNFNEELHLIDQVLKKFVTVYPESKCLKFESNKIKQS